MLDAALMRLMSRLDALERQAERRGGVEAARAVHDVLVQGTGDTSTTSTSFVNIADLDAAITTSGGVLLAIMTLPVVNNTAFGANNLALRLDAGTDYATFQNQTSVVSLWQTMVHFHRWTGVAAGDHHVYGRWAAGAGQTLTSYSTYRKLLVLELE